MRRLLTVALVAGLCLAPGLAGAQAPAQPATVQSAADRLDNSRLALIGVGVIGGLVAYNLLTRALGPAVPPPRGLYIGPPPTAAVSELELFGRPALWHGVAPATFGTTGAVLANWLYGKS